MENKLTAVEFLADNLHYLHSTKWDDILIKAKEMEKQQIIKTGLDCGSFIETEDMEQYYTSTYGSKGSDETKQ